MNVYVATSGKYDSLIVEGVFSTKEKAKQYANKFDDVDVIEYLLDVLKERRYFIVEVTIDGKEYKRETIKDFKFPTLPETSKIRGISTISYDLALQRAQEQARQLREEQ